MLSIDYINRKVKVVCDDFININKSDNERVGVSFPILKSVKDTTNEHHSDTYKYYIVYFFYKEFITGDGECFKYERPFAWVMLDFKSGDVVEKYICNEDLLDMYPKYQIQDISIIPKGFIYEIKDMKCSTRLYNILCELFDDIRTGVVLNGYVNKNSYKEYLDRLEGVVGEDIIPIYKGV